jgi:MFS family permease
MSTIVLLAGIVGMLCGGPLTDYSARRLGRRWGRSLPMIICYACALLAYLSCLYLDSAWACGARDYLAGVSGCHLDLVVRGEPRPHPALYPASVDSISNPAPFSRFGGQQVAHEKRRNEIRFEHAILGPPPKNCHHYRTFTGYDCRRS